MNFLKKYNAGVISFLIVLILMPIGHLIMVLVEKYLSQHMYLGATLLGFSGLILLIVGFKLNHRKALASVWGLLAAILVWTGWVEFSFVWIAHKLNVSPLMVEGEIVTKPEYLVMMSSLGILSTLLVALLFTQTGCTLIMRIQHIFGLKTQVQQASVSNKPVAITTFLECIIIIWFFYILLLLAYDEQIAGDRHPFTYFIAFGSLLWSLYLFIKLIRIKKFDYALRYAIPTVIIFWNFVEIAGRWNLFKEVWIHPAEHWLENTLLGITLVAALIYFIISSNKYRLQKMNKLNV